MIALARANYAVGDDKLSFAEADARSLAYTARFDVVFSNAALHWTKESTSRYWRGSPAP